MQEDRSTPVPKTFIESVVAKGAVMDKAVFEESAKELPLVIFPEIRAITGNWLTKNYTYYPAESLIGNPSQGTGLVSFTNPYNIPILRDHMDSPGFFGGFSSDPYGRVYSAEYVMSDTGNGWVRAIPAITDPWAINMVMSGRFLTVSIGTETDEVYCSVCMAQGKKINMLEEGRCEHYRGESYDGVLCYWQIGPIKAREISFVNVPADVNAGVLNKNLDIAEVKTMISSPDAQYLLDMATGAKESASSYCLNRLNISRRTFDGIVSAAHRRKDETGQRNLSSALTSGTIPLRQFVKGI